MAMHETIAGKTYDELIGDTKVALITKNVTVAQGAEYKRGTVLGKMTTDSKYKMVTKAASDGSQVADAILAFDVDASKADTVATVYIAGIFNREKLVVGNDTTVDAHEDELRDKNIYLTSLK